MSLRNLTAWRVIERVGVMVVCAVVQSACGAQVEGTDSSTHWLDSCGQDSDCGSGLSCECGSCTKVCDSTADCNGLGVATCAQAECGASAVAACARTCNENSDCGDGDCWDGACVFASQCEENSCFPNDEASTPNETDETSEQSTDGSTDTEDSGADPTSTESESSEPPAPTCPGMDVASNGDECIGDVRTYWDGVECVTVNWCGCDGAECANMFMHQEDCRTKYAACTDLVAECSDQIDLEIDDDFGAARPASTGIYFEVVGEEPGQYEEVNPTVIPLADFTVAEWRGPGASDSGISTTLDFLVNGESHAFYFYFGNSDWPFVSGIGDLEPGSMVELRVVRYGGVPTELQVREPNGAVLLWFVQSAPTGNTTQWSFGDLSARVGAPICKRVAESCNWMFTLNELVVSFGEYEVSVDPESGVGGVPPEQGPPQYEVLNSYSFSSNQPAFGDEMCGALMPRYDGFVVWRDDNPED